MPPINYTGEDLTPLVSLYNRLGMIEGVDYRVVADDTIENKTRGDIYLIKTGKYVEVKNDYRGRPNENNKKHPTDNIFCECAAMDCNGEKRPSGIYNMYDIFVVIIHDRSSHIIRWITKDKFLPIITTYPIRTKYPDDREKKQTWGHVMSIPDWEKISTSFLQTSTQQDVGLQDAKRIVAAQDVRSVPTTSGKLQTTTWW